MLSQERLTLSIPCGVEGAYKWFGITCYGTTKLFCAPRSASDILVLEDPRPILGLPVDNVTGLEKDETNTLQEESDNALTRPPARISKT